MWHPAFLCVNRGLTIGNASDCLLIDVIWVGELVAKSGVFLILSGINWLDSDMEINLVCVDEFCLSFGLSWLYCSGNICEKGGINILNLMASLNIASDASANVCLMCTKIVPNGIGQ